MSVLKVRFNGGLITNVKVKSFTEKARYDSSERGMRGVGSNDPGGVDAWYARMAKIRRF